MNTKSKTCLYYSKGNCNQGNKCKFIHDKTNNDNIKNKIIEKNNFKQKNNTVKKNQSKINILIKNEMLENLNHKRNLNSIQSLEISFIEENKNNYILFFYNKNFIFLYNKVDNKFNNNQIFMNKNIKSAINTTFKGNFGDLGEFISLGFNYYNEVEMIRHSSICFKNNIEDDGLDFILEISDLAPIELIYHDEYSLIVTFTIYDENQNLKHFFRLYDLSNIKKSNFEENMKNLKNKYFELTVENKIEKIFTFQKLYFN